MGEAMTFAHACRVDDRQCTGRLMSLTQIKARRAHCGEHSLSSDRQWFWWRRALQLRSFQDSNIGRAMRTS
jgi:hypothetical protein